MSGEDAQTLLSAGKLNKVNERSAFLGPIDDGSTDKVDQLFQLIEGRGAEAPDASEKTTTIDVGGERVGTVRFVAVEKCKTRVPSDLLAKAMAGNVIPKTYDWDRVSIDNRTGELCVPKAYAELIDAEYGGTAAGAASEMQKYSGKIAEGKNPRGATEALMNALKLMSGEEFDATVSGLNGAPRSPGAELEDSIGMSSDNKRHAMRRRATPPPAPRAPLEAAAADAADPLLDLAMGLAPAERPPPPPAILTKESVRGAGCLALPRARCGRAPDGEGSCSWSWWYGTCLPDDVYQGIGLVGFKTERARRFIHDHVDRPMSRALAKVGTKVAAVLATFIEYAGAPLPGLGRLIEALPPDLLDLFSSIRAAVSQTTASAAGLGADAVRGLLGEAAGAMGAQLVELCVAFLGRYLAVTAGAAAMALIDEFVDALDALVARHVAPGSLAQHAASGAAGAVRWIGILVAAAVAATVASGVATTVAAGGAVSWVAWVFFAGVTLAGRSWGLDVVKAPLLLFTTAARSLGWVAGAAARAAASVRDAAAANVEHFEQDKAAAAAVRVRIHDLEASRALPPEAAAALRGQLRDASRDLAAMTAEAEAAHAETGGVPGALVVRIHARTVAVQAAVAAAVRDHYGRLEARLREATRELARAQGPAAAGTAPRSVRALRAEVEATMGALAHVAREPGAGADAAAPAFAPLLLGATPAGARAPGLTMAFHHVSTALLPRAQVLGRAIKVAARARTKATAGLAAARARAGEAPREEGASLRAWQGVLRRASALVGSDAAAAERELKATRHLLKVAKSFFVQARIGAPEAAAQVARSIKSSPQAMRVLADRLASRAWRATVQGGLSLGDLEAGFRRLSGAGLLAAHEALLLTVDARDAAQLDRAVAPRDRARPALLGSGALDPRLLSFAYGMMSVAPLNSSSAALLDWSRRSGDAFAGLRAATADAVRSSDELEAAAARARAGAAALLEQAAPTRGALEALAREDPTPQVATCAELIAGALGGRTLGDALVAVARDDQADTVRAFDALWRELAGQRPPERGAVGREIFLMAQLKEARGRGPAARLEALRAHVGPAALARSVIAAVKRFLSREVVTSGSAGAALRRAGAALDPAVGAEAVIARATGDAISAAVEPTGPRLGGPHAARVLAGQRHSWNAAHDAGAAHAHVALPTLVAGVMTHALRQAQPRGAPAVTQ